MGRILNHVKCISDHRDVAQILDQSIAEHAVKDEQRDCEKCMLHHRYTGTGSCFPGCLKLELRQAAQSATLLARSGGMQSQGYHVVETLQQIIIKTPPKAQRP